MYLNIYLLNMNFIPHIANIWVVEIEVKGTSMYNVNRQ